MVCEEYKTLSQKEFHNHIRDQISTTAWNIVSQIAEAVHDAAEAVHDEGFGPDITDEEKKHLAKVWRENLGIDIYTIDRSDDPKNALGGNPAIEQSILDYVFLQLDPLLRRADTLPAPKDAFNLMSTIKEKLYGPGFRGGKGDTAHGPLGEIVTGTADIRTDTDKLANWDSGAATSYKNFLSNVGEVVVPHQRDELNTLAHLADLNYGLTLEARKDICGIAEGAVTASQEMVDSCGDGADGNVEGVAAYVGVVAAAMAIGGAVLAAEPVAIAVALSVGSAVVGGSAPFLEKLIGETEGAEEKRKEEYSFGAKNWKEMLERVADAANLMEINLDSANSELAARARELLSSGEWKDPKDNLTVKL